MDNKADVGSRNIMAAGDGRRDDPSNINPSHVALYLHQHHSDLWPVDEEFHIQYTYHAKDP